MSAVDAKALPRSGGGHGKAAGKALHSGRLAGMAFMQRAAQRKQLQERKEQAVRALRLIFPRLLQSPFLCSCGHPSASQNVV